MTEPPIEGDPGEFQKIIFDISIIGKCSFSSKDVWDKLDNDFILNNNNYIKSSRLFLFKTSKQVIILLFGHLFGTGRELSLIQIRNNKIKLLLDEDFNYPIKLTDINGKIEFIGKKSDFEYYQAMDSLNADIGTYAPFFIYTIDNDIEINEELMKKYNKDNYIYAGQRYNEEIKILYPRGGGRPSILK